MNLHSVVGIYRRVKNLIVEHDRFRTLEVGTSSGDVENTTKERVYVERKLKKRTR